MGSSVSEEKEIALALQGQTLHVPDLSPYFAGWPTSEMNSHYHELIAFVDSLLARMLLAEDRVQRYKGEDMALFASLWYPHASWEELQTLSIFVIWLFCWDDTVDTNEYNLAHDLEKADKYRADTVASIGRFLDLDSGSGNGTTVDGVNAVLQAFGDRLSTFYRIDQKQLLLDEINRFVRCCGTEQALRLHGKVPEYGVYIEMRLGTTAVFTLCALVEYEVQEHLPSSVMHSSEMQTVWEETNMGIVIVNDILSLKKELATMCVINAVPAMMKQGLSLTEAVDNLLVKLRLSVNTLDQAASRLSDMTKRDAKLGDTVRRYCDACRVMVTGTWQFSLKSKRYNITKFICEDGSLDIAL